MADDPLLPSLIGKPRADIHPHSAAHYRPAQLPRELGAVLGGFTQGLSRLGGAIGAVMDRKDEEAASVALTDANNELMVYLHNDTLQRVGEDAQRGADDFANVAGSLRERYGASLPNERARNAFFRAFDNRSYQMYARAVDHGASERRRGEDLQATRALVGLTDTLSARLSEGLTLEGEGAVNFPAVFERDIRDGIEKAAASLPPDVRDSFRVMALRNANSMLRRARAHAQKTQIALEDAVLTDSLGREYKLAETNYTNPDWAANGAAQIVNYARKRGWSWEQTEAAIRRYQDAGNLRRLQAAMKANDKRAVKAIQEGEPQAARQKGAK